MDKELIYHGIDKMESIGATGEGITILVRENPYNEHSKLVASAVKWVTPKANIIRDNIDHRQLLQYLIDNKVDIINISQATNYPSEDLNSVLREFIKLGGIVFCAAGNWTDKGPFGVGKEVAIMIGAGSFRKDGKVYRDTYSGIHEEMDFMFISDKLKMNNGTSFTSPMAAAWAARLLSLKKFTQQEMYQIMMEMSIPLSDDTIEGWDKWNGWGSPQFDLEIFKKFYNNEPSEPPTPEPKPEPPTKEIKIEMFIGSRTYYVNGKQKQMDVSAELYNGRTFVPVRFISEEFGSTVGWNGILKKVTIKGDKVVTMVIGKREYHVDGVLKYMDTAPMLVNGRTMVPVRFIAEAFGYKIGWDGSAQKVTIAK